MITAQEFENKTGRVPQDDDLDRVNCDKAGTPGHRQCGWCPVHDAPRFMCSCRSGAEIESLHGPTSAIEIAKQELGDLKGRIITHYDHLIDHSVTRHSADEAARTAAKMALTVDDVISWLGMF